MKESIKNKLESIGKIAEIKRILSTIHPSSTHDSQGCYMVTSSEPQEGKTTLCAGLALAAAEQNSLKVLAVDCNWHAPALHEYFDVDPYFAISEIDPDQPMAEMVRSTWLKNLDVLPAVSYLGDDPAFNGTGWSLDLLKKARDTYDYIFVDTASIYPTNYRMMDPLLISQEANGVVLVALTNVTSRQTLKRASMAMKTQGATLLGVVANHWQNPMI